MYYGYGYGNGYLLILIVSMILGGLTQSYIKSTYRKWSRVKVSTGMTGADTARAMLNSSGASSVSIGHVDGQLTDYFDPRSMSLHLSPDNFAGGSVASVAVACHEAGHAVQTQKGYWFGRLRTAMVPVVNFSQRSWGLILMLGFMMNLLNLVRLAIVLFAFTVVFQLVTLPVEIDASRRAVAYLKANGTGVDEKGARQVLTAAALTYVAAALVSIMQLVYYVLRMNSRDNR